VEDIVGKEQPILQAFFDYSRPTRQNLRLFFFFENKRSRDSILVEDTATFECFGDAYAT